MQLAPSACANVQDAKKPFVAYFGAAGTLGRPRMHAWVSRSTHGLRERLRAEPHGLVFSTPLAPSADVRFRDERMQAELMEASQVGHAASLQEVNRLGLINIAKSAQSLCFAKGAELTSSMSALGLLLLGCAADYGCLRSLLRMRHGGALKAGKVGTRHLQ